MSPARLACGSAPMAALHRALSSPKAQKARSDRGWPAAALTGLLTSLLMGTAQAEDIGGGLTSGSSHGVATTGSSPLSSMWQRHADRVRHFHLGQARFDLSLAAFDIQHQRARLFGDYYLTGPGFGEGQVDGGLRLTSGLAFGRTLSSLSLAAPGSSDGLALGREAPSVAQPYLGLGYSSLAPRAGWAFSADIGLGRWVPADRPRLGQGGPSDSQVERLLDDLRLSPVIQLGVRYAF